MIKRANKLTSLFLVAAAAVSLIPSTGVNAAERLGTKEGNIEHAVAFKDGKYLYEGYRTDDDDTGFYYNTGAGSKDKELKDAEDYDYVSKYGEKYAYLKDGDDEYLVDLSTGRLIDDEVPEDKHDTAVTKLRTALKKTDMYDDLKADDADKLYLSLKRVDEDKLGETWYQYSATTGAAATDVTTAAGAKIGFTNGSGKYIHVSYTANMYIYNKDKNKAVKIEKYNSDKEDLNVTLESIKFLAQDKDNIYTLTKVKVNKYNEEQYFVQKISKTQGDKEDDAYLPKSVNSYQLNNEYAKDSTIYDNDDSKDAYNILTENHDDIIGMKADGNTLYVYKMDSDDVKVNKINLKKVKVDVETSYDDKSTDKTKNTNQVENVDTYLAKKDGDEGQDVDGDAKACSIDIDGNLWTINDGKIYKFTGKDKKEMYTCDRSLDRLDVYNSGSLIAWEDGSDAYTTVQEGKKVTEDETTPAQTGWINTAAGWTFYDASGKQVKHNWVNSGGKYYYLNENGIMESGKWICPFGNWYLLNADGTMANSGWVCPYGNWYYLNSNGNPLTGWQYINGSWYYMNSEGTMKTGWQYINGSWYYLQSSGAMKTGWLNDNGTWYYLNSSGAMLANTTIGGYKLGSNGAWIR